MSRMTCHSNYHPQRKFDHVITIEHKKESHDTTPSESLHRNKAQKPWGKARGNNNKQIADGSSRRSEQRLHKWWWWSCNVLISVELAQYEPIRAQMYWDSRPATFLTEWTSAASNTHWDTPPVTWLTFPETAYAGNGGGETPSTVPESSLINKTGAIFCNC